MAKKTRIVWQKPLTNITNGMQKYGKRALVAVRAVGEYVGAHMQNEARQNAPWEDRTGNARTGLFGTVVQEAAQEIVEIYLSHGHTVFYGKFLELSHGGKYAIIMPTIEKYLPELKRLLDDLFR
jgi:hypothetical protein